MPASGCRGDITVRLCNGSSWECLVSEELGTPDHVATTARVLAWKPGSSVGCVGQSCLAKVDCLSTVHRPQAPHLQLNTTNPQPTPSLPSTTCPRHSTKGPHYEFHFEPRPRPRPDYPPPTVTPSSSERSRRRNGARHVLPQQGRGHAARDPQRPSRPAPPRSPAQRLQLAGAPAPGRAGPAATTRLVRRRGGQGHGHQEGARQGASRGQIR